MFVVTHRPPPEDWDAPATPFTFVDDVVNAVARAREAAGDRDVGIGPGSTVTVALSAGLLDVVTRPHAGATVVPSCPRHNWRNNGRRG